MLKINETKINNFFDKKIDIKLYPKIKMNSLLIDYLNSYIDFIRVKKILKYKTVNQIDFNIFDHINKKYKSVELIKIGEGDYGSVYKINNNTCVKIEEIDISSLYKNIIKKNDELKISTICGDKKIGPKIFFNDIIYNEYYSYFYYYTYMEFIDGVTIYNFLENPTMYDINTETKKKIFKLFTQKKNILNKLGYIHNDLHLNNIILKIKNKKIIDLFIIDYGLSKSLKNTNVSIVKKYLYEYNNDNLIMYFIYKKYIEINFNDMYKILDIYKNTVNINIKNTIYKNIIYNSQALNNIFKNICENKNKTKIIETNNIMEYLEEKYKILDIINDISKYYFFEILSYSENKYYEEFYKIVEVVKDNEKYLILLYKVYNLEYQTNRTKNIHLINIFSNKSIFHIGDCEYIIDKYNTIFSLSIKIPNDLKIIDIKPYFEIEDIILLDKKIFLNKVRQLYKNMISLKYSIKYLYSYQYMFFTLKNNKINKIYYFNAYNTLDNYYIENINRFSNNQNIYFTNKLIENKIVIIK